MPGEGKRVMAFTWVERLQQAGLPLTAWIERTKGFHIGGYKFVAPSIADSNGISSVSEDGTIRMITSVQAVEHNFVIRHIMENLSDRWSEPIYELEPLKLTFGIPGNQWRHLYANGGTSESHYPPTAYRTLEHACSEEPFRIESHPGGRSSNLHLPLLIALASDNAGGDGLICGMEWSGGWYIAQQAIFDPEDGEFSIGCERAQSQLAIGIKVNGIRLQPGERLSLPAVHIGFFSGGPRAGTLELRKYLYKHVCAQYQGQPMVPAVSYDHWFGIDNAINEQVLRKQAKRAADLGVETFVVDASWFPGGFPDGVGNWEQADELKFPQGLEPLAAYVRQLGMGFGLWFEPERASRGTRIAELHADWFITLKDSSRYHMNLALKPAQDYLIEMIGGWVERLQIVWIRWDYNIDPQAYWESVDPSLKLQFHYMEGLYRVLDILLDKYPNLIIEGCASGGRRIDLGTIRRSHTFWFSDQSKDAGICRYMQARANRFLPGHLLNSSVAVEMGQGDAGFNGVSVLSRMMGKLAFDGDIASWSPQLTAVMKGWVVHFKRFRHLLGQNFYQLSDVPASSADGDAVQFSGYSGDESVVFIFSGNVAMKRTIPLFGLHSERSYAVRSLVSDEPEEKTMRCTGLELLESGIQVDLVPDRASLVRLTRI